MICPYIENFQYHEQLNVPKEDNEEYLEKVVVTNMYRQMTCKREGCDVWYEGRCHYNG